jgi:hypothetical protein
MKPLLRGIVLTGLGAFFFAGIAFAQGMPPMSPQAQAKMTAWRTWRDSHKHVTTLERTLRSLGQMEQDPKTRLNKPQAKAVLAVIHKWQGKPAVSDTQAAQIGKQLTGPLNVAQLKKLAASLQERPHHGFGGPGGPGGPGRFGGPGGPRGPFDPSAMPSPRDYNPLNPNTDPMVMRRDRVRQNLTMLVQQLSATAK